MLGAHRDWPRCSTARIATTPTSTFRFSPAPPPPAIHYPISYSLRSLWQAPRKGLQHARLHSATRTPPIPLWDAARPRRVSCATPMVDIAVVRELIYMRHSARRWPSAARQSRRDRSCLRGWYLNRCLPRKRLPLAHTGPARTPSFVAACPGPQPPAAQRPRGTVSRARGRLAPPTSATCRRWTHAPAGTVEIDPKPTQPAPGGRRRDLCSSRSISDVPSLLPPLAFARDAR